MTDHTHHITVIAEADSGPQRALDVRPAGDHLLWDPDSPPTHVDAEELDSAHQEAYP